MTSRSTFTITFAAQKGKPKSDGRVPILARIIINREKSHFSTKLHIAPDRWNTKEGRPLGSTRNEKEIGAMLDDYRTLVKNRYNEMVLRGEMVTASKLKIAVMNLDDRRIQLLELCDKFNEDYEQLVVTRAVTRCTFQRYILTRQRLAEYIKEKYRMDDIPLPDINHQFIKGFDLWNRTQHGSAVNTAARFIKHFRTMFNMGLNNGWVHLDPFANYKIQFKHVNRGYLTQHELKLIADKDLSNPRLEVVKDMFLFSCYTGLAYIDVRQLTTNDMHTNDDGSRWIITTRQKTNNPVHIRLLDIPMQIIDKYQGTTKGGKLLPIPSNQKTNDYLKEIATICGIEKNLTFHLARHTFATTVTLENGVPIETVSKMLGHSSIKTTQIYARITNAKISHDMEVLAQKLNATATQAVVQ